jgi:enamine deaminase RidA (YjgF/YER057c/UK114 family)
MPIIRLDPPNLYTPYNNVYTQVIKATGAVHIHVAGTVSLDVDRNLIGEGDMALQVETTFENIRLSLEAFDATPADVVRINIFTLDVDQFLQLGTPIMATFFGATTPTSTLAGVTRLADPRYLVEIQADALRPGN